MSIFRLSCCIVAAALLLPASLFAQPISAPDDAKFVVRINLAAIQKTDLGGKLMHAIRNMAAEEFGDDKDPEEAFEAIEEALGFDPFDELRAITLFGSDLEDPAESLQGVLEMGSTTGNLEGLLLALPGYDSSEHGKHLIHMVAPDSDVHVFGAIHGKSNKRVVVATDRGDVETMLDKLDGRRSSSPSDRDAKRMVDNDALVSVRLVELPELDIDGPPKALLKLIRDAAVSVKEYGENLKVELKIDTDTDKHAEQLQQLAQGAAAMVGLANDSEDGDEELELIAGILETLESKRDEKSIRLSVEIPNALVIEFLREEADLPLPR